MEINTQYYGCFPSLYRSASSLAHCVIDKIKSVFYQCTGDKERCRANDLLSKFYFERASAFVAFFLFGQSLITPVVNMERLKSLTQPLNLNKIDTCYQNALAKKPTSVHLYREKFPSEKITKGICLAFALKFISKYLQALQSGQDPQTTVRTLGEKYKEGGTERTAIVHGLQFITGAYNKLDRAQTLANLFGIELSIASLCCKFTSWNGAEKSLNPQLESLEDGAYFVNIDNKNPQRPGHLVAYLKDRNHHFLFDPQLGTVQIPQGKDASYLIKSLKYASGNQLTFYKAALHTLRPRT
jgi:hypothetical protein